MPRMRIIVDVDVPEFKVQGDRTRFNAATLDVVKKTWPDAVFVSTEDLTFSNELWNEERAAGHIRLVPIGTRRT